MFKKIVPFLQKCRQIQYIYLYNILKVILPLNENKIILASNRDNSLSGNLLWIYNELPEKYEVKIFTQKEAHFIYKIKLISNMANAKYTIIDDFFQMLYPLKIRKNAKLIQVWHAVGAFKKVGFSRIGKKGGPNQYSLTHRNYTDVIVSSESIIENYMESFKVSKDKIHAIGVPRTDFFFDENLKRKKKEELYIKYPILKNKKIILFAPTFRGESRNNAYYPAEFLNIEKIYNALNDNEILLIKHHPFVKQKVNISEEQSTKIIDLTSFNDINELLLITDLLITDYSSIIFEYALLNKPIIFYVPDIVEYKEKRDFYYEFEEYTYGCVCKNLDELIYSMRNTKIDEEKLQKFKHKFLNMCDGQATKRFVSLIL